MADETEPQDEVNDGCAVFSDEPQVQGVWIKSKDGTKKKYYLKELMGPDLAKWQTFDAARIKVVRNRIDMEPDAFKEYSATLISMCMYDEDDKQVPVKSIIKSWPATTINGLFEMCQTMNGLNAEGRDQAKKA
jgi:hypothetical protein